ncbi:MAG TPA: sodium:solute symporter family protein [Longimicrobiales bacterium]|nr:sodium:solute symporter family protein [Longimicrobiales bacterium]
MQTPQLIIVGGYFLLIFAVGLYATRYVRDSTDFLLAGRRLGVPLAAAALAATHFGGGFVVGTGGWGFRYGLSGMAYAFGVGLSLLLLAVVSARRMRRLGLVTVPDYLELRYGSRAVRLLGAVLSLAAIIGILGAQVWASQGALSILGIDPTLAAVAATILFIVYTAASGLWGVTLTDALQLLIIFIGIPIAAVLGLRSAGGFAGIREGIAGMELEVTTSAFFEPLGAGGVLIVAAILPTLMYTLIGQDFYQRLFAARDAGVAVRAALLAGAVLIIYAAFPALAGMAARGIFGDGIEPSQAIPMLVVEVLPVWSGAIVVGAILGAIMSTADSLLIAGTSHLTNDIYVKVLNPAAAEDTRRLLLISRLGTVAIGVLALLLALSVREIIGLLLLSYTMYAAGVFVPVVLGLYWQRGTAAGAIAGILGGAVAGVAAAQGWITLPVVPEIVAGAVVSLVLYVAVSLVTTQRAGARPGA